MDHFFDTLPSELPLPYPTKPESPLGLKPIRDFGLESSGVDGRKHVEIK